MEKDGLKVPGYFMRSLYYITSNRKIRTSDILFQPFRLTV